MKIALVNNASNFATSLSPELRRRGHEVKVVSPWNMILEKPDFVLGRPGRSLARKALDKFKLRLLQREEWDLVLNYGSPLGGFNGPEVIYWQGAELFWDTSPGMENWMKRPTRRRGYYCTPDIARFLSEDSILLPRACGISKFSPSLRKPKTEEMIRIGHFWKRMNLPQSYFNRYWKKSDVLFEAIKILTARGYMVELVEGPIQRDYMPQAMANLDVFIDEFCNLSHSMTAIEALLSGTPVIGSYDPSLCECKQALDQMVNVPWIGWYGPDPEVVAEKIVESSTRRIIPAPELIDYFSPRHTADVLLNTWRLLT